MKIRINQKPAGVVLVVALFIVVAAGIVIASYLTLMAGETRNVGRSRIWNQCVPVMETGVEEALAQIAYCNNSTNLSSNSWTLTTNGYYQKTRTIGTDGSYCIVQIKAVSPPIIYSTAYVPIPGTSTNYLSREVKVTTYSASSASGGLTAKGTILISGSGQFDSFNSAAGPYNPASPGTNAVALSDSTSSGAISLTGGGHIYGMAVTGPGGTISTSGSAAVGSASWDTGGNNGVQSGWSANDANYQFNDISAPNTSGWISSFVPGKINGTGTNYNYLLSGGNYYNTGDFSIQGGQAMGVSGNCKLYVTGNFTIGGSGYLYLAPGATLTVYVGGQKADLSGSGIINGAGYAANLTIYGLPNCTSIKYSGGSDFVGTIDAPEAAFDLTAANSYGSVIANSIIIEGSGNFHYDQALGGTQGITMATWNEL